MSKPCSSFIKDCKGKISKITNLPYQTCALCNCDEGDFNIGFFGCKYDSTGKPLQPQLTKQPVSCGGMGTDAEGKTIFGQGPQNW